MAFCREQLNHVALFPSLSRSRPAACQFRSGRISIGVVPRERGIAFPPGHAFVNSKQAFVVWSSPKKECHFFPGFARLDEKT